MRHFKVAFVPRTVLALRVINGVALEAPMDLLTKQRRCRRTDFICLYYTNSISPSKHLSSFLTKKNTRSLSHAVNYKSKSMSPSPLCGEMVGRMLKCCKTQ